MELQIVNEKWSTDFEIVLENIRINCIVLTKEHKKRYILLKRTLKYYRIPLIIISAFNSVISVGGQPFIEQKYISAITCMLSLSCGIIGSIEMFFNIDSRMQNELNMAKEYYVLGTNIFKTLSLNKVNRSTEGKIFLDESFSIYIKLIESSSLVMKNLKDFLTPLPSELERNSNGSQSSSEQDV